jgi:hypothetical protein
MLKFRDGRVVIDVFLERKRGRLFFKDLGMVMKKELASFAVYRERPQSYPHDIPGK